MCEMDNLYGIFKPKPARTTATAATSDGRQPRTKRSADPGRVCETHRPKGRARSGCPHTRPATHRERPSRRLPTMDATQTKAKAKGKTKAKDKAKVKPPIS